MNVTVGKVVFDNVAYDREADVLYLHVGDPAAEPISVDRSALAAVIGAA